MLNPEFKSFFEKRLGNRCGDFRFVAEDFLSEQALAKKQRMLKKKVIEAIKIEEIGKRFQSDLSPIALASPAETVVSEKQFSSFTRKDLLLETISGVHMPVFAFYPKNFDPKKEYRVIIAAHGHGPGRFSMAGRFETQEELDELRKTRTPFAVNYVEKGYVVYCPDMWGFGSRRMKDDDEFGKSDCSRLSDACGAAGLTLAGLFVYDHMRLVDYISAQGFADDIGILGFSGGGQQSLYTAALDPRIAWCYCGGQMHYYRGSFFINHMCSCNLIPGLWKEMEMWEVACLVAPRPLLIENGDKDGLNGTGGIDSIKELSQKILRAYEACGVPGNILTNFFDGGHMYHGGRTDELISLAK